MSQERQVHSRLAGPDHLAAAVTAQPHGERTEGRR
jgi:hypothetical protein